jgi:hypothetical protein
MAIFIFTILRRRHGTISIINFFKKIGLMGLAHFRVGREKLILIRRGGLRTNFSRLLELHPNP